LARRALAAGAPAAASAGVHRRGRRDGWRRRLRFVLNVGECGVRRAIPFLFLLSIIAACSRQPAQRPAVDSEVQDVAPPPDASLSTEADPQARAVVPSFSGVLPESYPKDAPPYVPPTLTDFGDLWG